MKRPRTKSDIEERLLSLLAKARDGHTPNLDEWMLAGVAGLNLDPEISRRFRSAIAAESPADAIEEMRLLADTIRDSEAQAALTAVTPAEEPDPAEPVDQDALLSALQGRQ